MHRFSQRSNATNAGVNSRVLFSTGKGLIAVQVKRWKRNVQAPVVQQVRGSQGAHEQGLIITTSDFSSGARKEAARPDAVPVGLMNGEQLVLLLAEHGIGISRQSHDLFKLEEILMIAETQLDSCKLFEVLWVQHMAGCILPWDFTARSDTIVRSSRVFC